MRNIFTTFVILSALGIAAAAQARQQQPSKDAEQIDPPAILEIPDAPILTPAQSLETIQVVDGYRLELVASEPKIVDPVFSQFDEDNRLWVVEMMGYMTDAEGSDSDVPQGRISVLEDLNNDGFYETSHVFKDNLLLPRALCVLNDSVLFAETNGKLWRQGRDGYTATGTAALVDDRYQLTKNDNVEHAPNGLMWTIDNCLYNSKSDIAYAYRNGQFVRFDTENRGQWGLAQDRAGRILFNTNSDYAKYDLLPPNFAVQRSGALSRIPNGANEKRHTYGIRVEPGLNRAYRPGEVVNHDTWYMVKNTATSGILYADTPLFPEFQGNIFSPEPGGHLIKRLLVDENPNGNMHVRKAYEDYEFIASTDERFRPVNMNLGPDGALYVVDMYRGILQDVNYLSDYLARQYKHRNLTEEGEGNGRIWRIVPDVAGAPAPVILGQDTPAELVSRFASGNQWERLTAQRMLIISGGTAAIVPLTACATTHELPIARAHALWTLEGLGALDKNTLLTAAEGNDDLVLTQHILRLSNHVAQTPADHQLLAQALFENPQIFTDKRLATFAAIFAGAHAQYSDIPVKLWIKLIKANPGNAQYVSLVEHACLLGCIGNEAQLLAYASEFRPEFQEILLQCLAEQAAAQSPEALFELINSDILDIRMRRNMLRLLSRQMINDANGTLLSPLMDYLSTLPENDREHAIVLESLTHSGNISVTPLYVDGKPELIANWQAKPPAGMEDAVAKLDTLFVWQLPANMDSELAMRVANGRILYQANCAGCHGSNGRGLGDIPPVARSEWVLGPRDQLAAIILNGLSGSINVLGKTYRPSEAMPSFRDSNMTNRQLADLLTYIRNNPEWNIRTSAVSEQRVAAVHHAFANFGTLTAAQLGIIEWTDTAVTVANTTTDDDVHSEYVAHKNYLYYVVLTMGGIVTFGLLLTGALTLLLGTPRKP